MGNGMAMVKRAVKDILAENEDLRLRLEEAEETLRAIFGGEVDALVVNAPEGERIFTLEGADYPYRLLVESMNEGAVTLAPDGTIIYCNKALADMLKVPLEKIIGVAFANFVSTADAADFASLLGKCTQVSKGDMDLVTGNGEPFPVLLSCSAMVAGNSRGQNMVVTDLSEQKSAQQALQAEIVRRLQTAEELRKSEQLLMHQGRQAAMGEMIGNIAHQWRQPLNTLGLMVQKLQLLHNTGRFNEEELDDYCRKSMDTIMHMSKTIDDFRNFFRADKEKTSFRLLDVINKTISLVEGTFTQNQISIQLDAAGDPAVNGYPNEYSQVLLNIFLNARDAFVQRDISGPRLVTVRIYMEEGKTVVCIVDNAGGIGEDIMIRIFDPYFTTKGPDKGTGVGLFMSKTIIEKNMNGRITVRNTGAGAEFRIEV
ncbi:sensor histidine kinase, PAS domain-containing [Geotalea daltonii FRC-32]|uniref:histidine kinase n=2 Tax=Geotalea TaxID=2910589 RepID=B9M6C0_GEODF|nr:sensor histidine kinase, PAS domain-containing [Geotalea daltonii FRC-32]